MHVIVISVDGVASDSEIDFLTSMQAPHSWGLFVAFSAKVVGVLILPEGVGCGGGSHRSRIWTLAAG